MHSINKEYLLQKLSSRYRQDINKDIGKIKARYRQEPQDKGKDTHVLGI